MLGPCRAIWIVCHCKTFEHEPMELLATSLHTSGCIEIQSTKFRA